MSDKKVAAYQSLEFGVAVVTDYHPEVPDRFTSWIERDGEPIRMPQGGIDTYPNRDAAAFAARCLVRRLKREAENK